MAKKKVCFIAQFPPPIHGLSKAVDTLYNSNLRNEFEFQKIDITNNKKFFKTLISILKSKADLFYFTISQTKCGNLRDLVILKLLNLQHKKCIIHLHGGYYRQLVDTDLSNWHRKANYNAISKLAGTIVLGNSLRYIFKNMIEDNKIFVVPNCVDDEYLMSDEDFNHKIKKTAERKIKHVLYLSNFISSKGYPEVLKMAKLEKEREVQTGIRKYHFDFAGEFFEQSEKDFFFNYIQDNELENYITYHGVVLGDKKLELLKKCDFFALLTRYPNEGQPISILEAMGNGMVILTTDHAGIPDIVRNGVNGIVQTKNECPEKLFSKMETLDLCEIAINNRKLVYSKYIEKVYLENIKKCFFNI